MSAINLTKGQAITFDKESLLPIKAILSWSGGADLDLGCFVETGDGKRVIQALGRYFGSFDSDPYVQLDGDSLTGGVETLSINMTKERYIKRVLVYAYIYKGGHWSDVKSAQVEIQHPEHNILISLPAGGRTKSCVLFTLENNGNGGLELEPQERYFSGTQEDIDRAYGWGFRWHRASK